jgi:hypothetical protein
MGVAQAVPGHLETSRPRRGQCARSASSRRARPLEQPAAKAAAASAPAPRRPKLDTRNSIEAICDPRIAAYDAKVHHDIHHTDDKKFASHAGWHSVAVMEATGEALGDARRKIGDEIGALRRELKAAREQINELQRDKASPAIVGCKLDRAKFRAILFTADGTCVDCLRNIMIKQTRSYDDEDNL